MYKVDGKLLDKNH